jgi:hypothetical protein
LGGSAPHAVGDALLLEAFASFGAIGPNFALL